MNTPPEDKTILSFEKFVAIKTGLIQGNGLAVTEAWERLLNRLQQEVQNVTSRTSSVFPIIDYKDLSTPARTRTFLEDLRNKGSAIIRNVVSEDEVEQWTNQVKQYLEHNSHTIISQSDHVELHGLFWSQAQINARAHPNILAVQRFLMGHLWKTNNSRVSVNRPATCADRIRVTRNNCSYQSAATALDSVRIGRVDGGGVERWDPDGYGGRLKGGTYTKIWSGDVDAYDPWESNTRLEATTNLYDYDESPCSYFRMFQGILALDPAHHSQMELCALPLKLATAYWLLRPFFSPKTPLGGFQGEGSQKTDAFLSPANWTLDAHQSPDLHGAQHPGHFQEVNSILHPHLQLDKTLVPLPPLNAGDFIVWHPDTIYASTARNKMQPSCAGSCSASTTTIPNNAQPPKTTTTFIDLPICPLTLGNAQFLFDQRKAFILGLPPPDYNNAPHLCDHAGGGGGGGESSYLGRPGVQDVYEAGSETALRAMGLLAWDVNDVHETMTAQQDEAERRLVKMANDILFPDHMGGI